MSLYFLLAQVGFVLAGKTHCIVKYMPYLFGYKTGFFSL